MDLDISMRSSDCPYTVQFYGALFREGDVWICMEVMDTSLDKFYTKVYKHGKCIGEDILGKIAFAVSLIVIRCFESFDFLFHLLLDIFLKLQVVSALHYLYSQLRVIHRDVKPSNILINRFGQVKICDFGISGYLVDSVAKTIDAGCKPYMAVCIVWVISQLFWYFIWVIYILCYYLLARTNRPDWQPFAVRHQIRRLVSWHFDGWVGNWEIPLWLLAVALRAAKTSRQRRGSQTASWKVFSQFWGVYKQMVIIL